MKAIGFTTQFYTLWNIDIRPECAVNERGHVTAKWDKVIYTYLGNLSKDLSKAQEKAAEKGCENLQPDHDLYGRNRSFENYTPKEIVKEGLETCERSELLMICCANRQEHTKEAREAAVEVLLKKSYVENVNGILTASEHVEAMKQWFIDRENFMSREFNEPIFVDKNCNSEGELYIDRLRIVFENGTVQQYYNGYNYSLPKGLNGKAKRIKNKSIQLLDFTVDFDCDNVPYGTWEDSKCGYQFYNDKDAPRFYGNVNINVKDFKILK